MIKIIGISGSHKVNGNTSKLIKKILEGASYAGAKIKFFSLVNNNIFFCKGCYLCAKFGSCIIQKDDLKKIRNSMMDSNAIIIGSPTYDREISGQLKTFFDRLWLDIYNETFKDRYMVLVNTYNFTSGHTIKTIKELSLALGYFVVGSIKSKKLIKYKGIIDSDIRTQKKAFFIGVKLTHIIKKEKILFSTINQKLVY